MSTESTSPEKVDAQRANWEAFEFEVRDGETVQVRNTSHEEPADHEYTVTVRKGQVVQCSCPHHECREARCKHMRAVEGQPVLLQALARKEGRERDVRTSEGREECWCAGKDLACFEHYEVEDHQGRNTGEE